jgi:hypothetical protein
MSYAYSHDTQFEAKDFYGIVLGDTVLGISVNGMMGMSLP